MTYFIIFLKNPRNAAALAALCAVVLVGALFLERSFSPMVGFEGTTIALADDGGGSGGGDSGGGDGGGDGGGGGGGDTGGGCCGGDTGGGGDTGPGPGDSGYVPPPPPPPAPAPAVDYCPNLAGAQSSVPAGYIVDSNGNCVIPPTDVCVNIPGVQTSVPPGMVVDSNGNCTTPPPGAVVCTLTPSVSTVAPGGTSVLTWTSSNATSATLTPGGAIAVNGSQAVTVNSDTTYTATFTGAAGTISCTENIKVTSTPPSPSCTTNCGGGGGLNQPNISLYRQPGEQPLAFVSLSSIPYTGYDAGPFGIALFWMLLVGWSALVAWLIVIKRVPQTLIEKYAGAHTPHHVDEKVEPMAHVSHIQPSVLAMPRPHTKASFGDRPIPVSRFTSSRILAPIQGKSVHAEPAVHAPAHTEPAAAYIKTPVELNLDTDYVSAVPRFISWIAEGHSEKAFNFLRNLKLSQKSAQDFMEKVVCELDDAYRHRIDATTTPDAHTHAALSSLSNTQVEALIEALASAVDRSYGSEFTSAKIALVRALGVGGVKEGASVSAHTEATPVAQSHEKPATRIEAMHEEHKSAPAGDYVDDFILGQINRLRA